VSNEWLAILRFSSLARKGIDVSFFTTSKERARVSQRERHTCRCNCLGGATLQVVRLNGLLEHVKIPVAKLSVGRNGDNVVRILGANDVNAIDRVSVRLG
jgi:hypothetical protein